MITLRDITRKLFQKKDEVTAAAKTVLSPVRIPEQQPPAPAQQQATSKDEPSSSWFSSVRQWLDNERAMSQEGRWYDLRRMFPPTEQREETREERIARWQREARTPPNPFGHQ